MESSSSQLVDFVLSPKFSLTNQDHMSQLTTDLTVSEQSEHFASAKFPAPGQENGFPSSSALTNYRTQRGSPTKKAPDWTSEAIVHSSLAANHMQEQHYDQALTSYQQALRMYRSDYLKGGVAEKCNAAATLHNMGLLHKRCQRYHQAIACLEEAEELYRECSAQTVPQKRGEGVCLEYLLAETLQNRANLHFKYHRNIPAAIDCQEEVVTMLLDLGYSPQSKERKNQAILGPKSAATPGESIVFVRITDNQKVHLLSVSLRSLGNLYLQQGEQDDALGAYQEALDMLRCRQAKFPDLNLQKKIASILLSMACVYFSQNELDQAVVALDECIAIHGGDQTHPDVMTALNNLGLAYERKEDLDMAMQCYEDMLELKRRQLGENHVQVAEALITVAKMLERQGNMTDALERYQESLEIYRGALVNEDPSFGKNVAEVLSKISSLSHERGSVEDAVSAYQQVLTTRKAKTGETALDEANVFLGLANSFSQKQSFQAARDCITEARQLVRPLPRDDDQVLEINLRIVELESSLNFDLNRAKKALLLENRPANLEPVMEEAIADVTEDSTHPTMEESASQILKEIREEIPLRAPEESTIDSSHGSEEAKRAFFDDESSFVDHPMLVFPSAESLESEAFGQDKEPSVAQILRQITVTDEDDSAIELQCLALGRTRSTENTSVSTCSVTPETSVEERSPSTQENSRHELMYPKDEVLLTYYPDPELTNTVLEALDDDETSFFPDDEVVQKRMVSTSLLDDDLSLAVQSLASVPSEAFASSIGLNTYSNEADLEQMLNPLEASVIADAHSGPSGSPVDARSARSPKHDEKLHLIKATEAFRPTIEFEDDVILEYDTAVDEYRGNGDGSEYEYDSFGDGSVVGTDTEDEESVLSKYENEDLGFETEEGEHTDGQEDIYWDEEENREVKLTRSQEFDDDTFDTPLGLKEKTEVYEHYPSRADEDEQQSSHQRSPLLSKKGMSHSSPLAPTSDPKMSPRHRFVKALARPFRRKSQMSGKLDSTPEGEVAKIPSSSVTRTKRQLNFPVDFPDDDLQNAEEMERPIDFVKMSSASYDDSMSQITVHKDDFLSRKSENDNQEWSWGLNVFANIAEEFLSAKSIHNKGRKPEDHETDSVSSGEESDPFEDLSEKGTFESRPDADPLGLAIAITQDFDDEDDEAGARQLPIVSPGPNVEGIVQDVNSTMWKPPAMLSSPARRRNGSPKIQMHIDTVEKDLEEHKIKFGYHHETVATLLVRLALLRAEYGDTNLAIEAMLEALKIQKDLRDPHGMAHSLHLLADIYCRQEQYDLALRIYNDVQRIERRLSGPDHPDNANTLNKIGRVYANKGKFYQAMEKHQQALQVLKACVGENLGHPAVSETLIHIGEVYYRERNSLSTIRNNTDDYQKFISTGMLDVIARAHEDRGSYKVALGFLEEKLQLIKNENSDFPQDQLAVLLYNIGTLSCKSGVFLEAIDYYEQALSIQMKLGCTTVDVATAKVLIGTVEYHLGQYRKSLNLLERASTVFERHFGPDHEVVADTLHRIGIVKSSLWHHDDALDNLERALELQLILFGENDLAVLNTRLEICWIEMNQGTADDATLHMKGIMEKQQSLVGKVHPIVADTLLLIGKAYLLSGHSSKAVKIFRDSFSMRERFLGRDHSLQAETFHLIAVEGIRAEKFQSSLGMCKSVLDIRKETLGERHLDVATTLSSIGRCYVGTGKFAEALRSFEEALQIAHESVGENHPCVGDIYVAKGSLYLRKCHFRLAEETIEKGIEIYKTAEVHRHHVRMQDAIKLLEKVVRDEMLCV